jgi:hypothetical protein
MPLVPNNLKTSLKSAISAIQCDPDNADAALDAFCGALANSIDAYIKTATVTVNPGIPVATAGSPAAQTGATTGPGTGTLS